MLSLIAEALIASAIHLTAVLTVWGFIALPFIAKASHTD